MKEMYQDPKDGGFKWREKQTVKKETPFGDWLAVAVFAAIILAALLLPGCTVTKYVSPTGESFTRSSFGTKLQVSELTVTGDTNGIRSIILKGYASDQVQAIGVAVESAVSAAIKSVKP